MSGYVQNMENYLIRKGYEPKYRHPGIYCIKLDDNIVYIGKSRDMLKRVAQHYVGIKTGSEKKYRLIAELAKKGYRVKFDVLYYAKCTTSSSIQEEIGQKEGEYIRQYRPILNTQIPKEEDWRQYDYCEVQPDTIRLLYE